MDTNNNLENISKEKWYNFKEDRKAVIFTILVISILFVAKCIYNYYTGIAPISPYYKEFNSEYLGTEVNISNINNELSKIELQSLSMKSGNNSLWDKNKENNEYYISLDKETIDFIKELPTEYINKENNEKVTDKYLGETIDIYDYCVLSYTYENSDKTFVISKEDLDMIDISNIEKVDKNLYEFNSSNNQITTYYKDRGFRLYNLELVSEIGELYNKSNTYKVKSIKDKLKYTKEEDVKQEKVTINLDGLGTLNAEQLSCLREAPGLYYTTFDGILRLYNYKDELPYVFITNIDNYYFLCNSDDLQDTSTNGLYTANGWDNPESANYRTIALERKDNKGVYVIRVASEAPDNTLEEILNQFDYSMNNLK